MSEGQTAHSAPGRAASGRPRSNERPGRLDLRSSLLGGWVRVTAPDPVAPFWREEDGTRHSYGSLRCGLDGPMARELRQAHLEAIRRIAAAALAAVDQGDQRETARLAVAAGRLCEEIAGRWTPAAVEVPRH
jgi:hypothetical protein